MTWLGIHFQNIHYRIYSESLLVLILLYKNLLIELTIYIILTTAHN